MSSFRLSSAYSKAAVRLYIERKLGHAKATLHEHLHLKFVVGKRYRCEVHDSDSMDTSMDSASRPMQECVLIRHLDGEYEVELAAADQCHRLVRVKILHEIHVETVDDCDWSDEAYTRDSPQVLAAIAADFPYFRMEHRRPEPQHRTPWPIKFYHPPGSQHVRSRMDFDEVDYGIHFSPFLSDAMLPNLSGEKRTWLMKTVRMRRRLCVRFFYRLLILLSRHWHVRRTAAFGCTWVFRLACIPLPCRHIAANAALLSLQKLMTSTLAMLLKTANFLVSLFAACCEEEARSMPLVCMKITLSTHSFCVRAGLQRWTMCA